MNRELFFTEQIDHHSKTAKFDAFESQHIGKALRKTQRETIEFTDGKGNVYQGDITCLKPLVKVTFNPVKRLKKSAPYSTILAVGFIRHNRMDFIIEKCTELGISKFFLFSAKYSTYYTDNTSHWQKIMRQAIKQSLRDTLPEIITCSSFSDFISQTEYIKYKYIAEQDAEPISNRNITEKQSKDSTDILFAIGPEGGLDEIEKSTARSAGFIPFSFGKHRLRTETAAIVAASYINLFRRQEPEDRSHNK
jgi:16S rRNA (uracil1498-N3)-methyltransferase